MTKKRKYKKSVVMPLALLAYVTLMAAYFLPRNAVLSSGEKLVTLGVSYGAVFLLWLVLRRKERKD